MTPLNRKGHQITSSHAPIGNIISLMIRDKWTKAETQLNAHMQHTQLTVEVHDS